MKSTLELTISKYKAYVSNLEWNISKNVVTGDRLLKANTEISCYKEIIQDLEKIKAEIPTPPVQEAIAVLYNHYKVNCPDEMTFDEFLKMKEGDDDVALILRATLGAMEEYKSSAPEIDWELIETQIADILYDCNGTSGGAGQIIEYLKTK